MKAAWRKLWQDHSALIGQWGLFVCAWALAAVIFYLRYRRNFQVPNFFAEDGVRFTKSLLDTGFVSSLFTTFNGYYIWGIYALNQLALGLNSLVYGGHFDTIPKAIALVSYSFLGLCAALPVLVLRRQLNAWYLAALTLLLAFVPMPGTDYAVIGTLGNLKFAFVYVAFMLLVVRLRQLRGSRWIPLIDLGLVLCAYTSVTVYLLLPAVLLQDGLRPKDWWTRDWRRYVRGNVALWSTLVLGLVLLWQVYVVATQGIPKLPGYMDQPFQHQRLVEVFVARSYLYGLVYPVYKFLNDAWSIVILAGLLVLASWRLVRGQRAIFWLAAYAVMVTTTLFALNRPGVSLFFLGYQGGPVDQFFYTQNLMFDVAVMLLLAALLRPITRRSWQQAVVGVALVAAVLVPVRWAGSYGAKTVIQDGVPPLPRSLQQACALPGDPVMIHVYPTAAFVMPEPRRVACEDEP